MVLLGVLLLNPSWSDASCGDYVTVGGRSTAMSGHETMSRTAGNDFPNSSDPAPRCHGRFCSGNGQEPITPPTIPESNRHDDGNIAVDICVNDGPVGQSLVAEPLARAVHLGLSIYRPPKHFSA
jgi:hypothetical protein